MQFKIKCSLNTIIARLIELNLNKYYLKILTTLAALENAQNKFNNRFKRYYYKNSFLKSI
jgi:hypothetical protein